jgi:hypothetical protein
VAGSGYGASFASCTAALIILCDLCVDRIDVGCVDSEAVQPAHARRQRVALHPALDLIGRRYFAGSARLCP